MVGSVGDQAGPSIGGSFGLSGTARVAFHYRLFGANSALKLDLGLL